MTTRKATAKAIAITTGIRAGEKQIPCGNDNKKSNSNDNDGAVCVL